MNEDIKISVIISAIFLYGIYILFNSLKDRRNKNLLKEWAKHNNLHYQKKIRLGLFRSEKASIECIISGEYKGRRVFIFIIKNFGWRGVSTETYVFFNGSFYKKISIQDIDKLIENKNYLAQAKNIFGEETKTELIQVIAAHIFLMTGKEVYYEQVKKIYSALEKFLIIKKNFKDKVNLVIFKTNQGDINYNSPESTNFVYENCDGEIDRDTVEIVCKTIEVLKERYNKI
jgi:hypothetical protein